MDDGATKWPATSLAEAESRLTAPGQSFETAEITVRGVLCEHPAIADAALVGLSHATLGEVPAAVVQARGPVSEPDLSRFLATRLAAFKVPEKIHISPRPLPRNASGKVVKSALKAAFPA